TWASTTLVASHRPSMPTSITPTSTATSANHRKAAAVTASKYVGRTPVSASRSAIAEICSAKSSSLIGSPLRRIRSLIRSRWGEVRVAHRRASPGDRLGSGGRDPPGLVVAGVLVEIRQRVRELHGGRRGLRQDARRWRGAFLRGTRVGIALLRTVSASSTTLP